MVDGINVILFYSESRECVLSYGIWYVYVAIGIPSLWTQTCCVINDVITLVSAN